MPPPRSEHFVQFFDTAESRGRAVAGHLAASLRAGGGALAIMQPHTWAAVWSELQGEFDVQSLRASGRLVIHDADRLADTLIVRGVADPVVFDRQVAAAARMLAARAPLHAYGEIVDVLTAGGDLDAALSLEALWERLLAQVPLSLMCGYSAPSFVTDPSRHDLERVCRVHGRACTHADDMLGSWLLDRAGLAYDSAR